ncbi:MAG: FtsH protease activity modulator HflK [Alphaproteobacteria bacterium]|nr:FtsH protease activity modulator HflK [Alphaproteobacteria bacterium]
MAWGDNNQNPWGNSPWGKPPGGGNQGGGKPPQGPDFDDALKKVTEQLRAMFGGAGGNDGKRGFLLIVLAVFVLWLASGVYLVKSDEQGVVLRFGQYHRTTASGLNYHFPYPFESVLTPRVTVINRVEIGQRSGDERKQYTGSNLDERLMLTGDENIVDINFEVQWQIRSAADYLFNVRDPEMTVKTVAESAMREVIGHTPIAVALAEGKLEIAEATKKLLQQTLDDYGAGITVVSVNLLDTDPPAQVIDAFRDVQTARADLETSRNQADAYRNDILPRARGEAQKLILDAEGYKQEVIARAQGEASRFSAIYSQYKQAKDVTERRMYLETMEEIMSGMNKIIIGGKGAQSVLPYLPLPELKKGKTEAKP